MYPRLAPSNEYLPPPSPANSNRPSSRVIIHTACRRFFVFTSVTRVSLSSVPVVLQSHAGLMGIAKTNEWGEFRFEFNFEPGVSLEIGARENYWISVSLPDSKSVMGGTTEESQIPETSGDSEAQKDVHPEKRRTGKL